MIQNENDATLTVYILIDDEEIKTFYNLIKRYPSVILENTRRTKSGFNVAIRQCKGKSDELIRFKKHFKRKIKQKREKPLSFIQLIKKIFGV